jgi:putative ABC transport system permease protein
VSQVFYNLRLVWKSLKRDRWFTIVMVVSQALSVSIFVTALTTTKRYSNLAGQVQPDVYRVEGHMVSALHAYFQKTQFEGFGELARVYVSLPHARTLMATGLTTAQTPTFVSDMVGIPAGGEAQRVPVRFASADLFSIFNVDFRYGRPWGAESSLRPVTVLSDILNQTLFGGADSVGRTVRLGGRDFTVVGVIRQRPGKVHLWDAGIAPENFGNLIVPLGFADQLRPRPLLFWPLSKGDKSWADSASPSFAFVDFWVRLPDAAARDRFLHALRTVDPNLSLRSADEILARYAHAPPPYRVFLIFTLVVVEASVINLMRTLLAKSNARAAEIGIHRALGAGRETIFLRQLTEGALVSLVGSIAGLVLALPTVVAFDRLVPDSPVQLAVTPAIVATTLLVCLAAGLVSGVYPAWRIASVPPTRYLGKI